MPNRQAPQLKTLLLEKKRLHLLLSFHRRSLLTHNTQELLALLSQEIKQILEADRVTFFLLDTRKEEVYAIYAMGLESSLLPTLRFPIARGIAGQAVRTGKVVNAANAYNHPNFDPRFDELYKFKTKSALAVPLRNFQGDILGVLEAFNKANGGKFTKEDEDLVALIASQLTSTLENSQLVDELKRSNLEAIYILAQAAEYRDQEDTARHLKRISDYSTILSKTMNLPLEKVEMIRLASPLHDIGKIAIRDAILRKPGPFTPEEHDEMKKHTTLGYEMLKDARSPLLQLARVISLAHHERFDGNGYPNKLKGNNIPLEARIISLADVFDALSSPRIYKPSWPMERVIDYINNESTKHFDPEVVKAFNASLPKLQSICLNNIANT